MIFRRSHDILSVFLCFRDDLHLWLTPFTKDGSHYVTLSFEEPITIAMLRIWVSLEREVKLTSMLEPSVEEHIIREVPS